MITPLFRKAYTAAGHDLADRSAEAPSGEEAISAAQATSADWWLWIRAPASAVLITARLLLLRWRSLRFLFSACIDWNLR